MVSRAEVKEGKLVPMWPAQDVIHGGQLGWTGTCSHGRCEGKPGNSVYRDEGGAVS
jgi:hypothetical protein